MLDLEIGGTTAGTVQDDVLNVSGTCVLNGVLNLRFDVRGGATGPHVRCAHREWLYYYSPCWNSRVHLWASGTFAIQLVNDGKTLRLADYMPGAVTFSSWVNYATHRRKCRDDRRSE